MSLFSLSLDTVEAIFEEDMFELLERASTAFEEGRTHDVIEYSFRAWQMQRSAFIYLLTIAMWYTDLNNPEMAGRFLLEAVKRSPATFDKKEVENRFTSIWEESAFLAYRDEALKIIEQRNRNRGYVSHVEVVSKIRYRTVLPDNFDSDKRYHVLIFLHDNGYNPTELLDFLSGMFIENNIILVVPEAPHPREWSLFALTGFDWSASGNQQVAASYILSLNKALREKYNVSSMYLAGLSQGGAHALSIGLQNQDSFDGLISFYGDLSLIGDSVVENGKIPVLMISTDADLAAYDSLKAKGYKVELYQFDGDYGITSDTVQKVISWMSEN